MKNFLFLFVLVVIHACSPPLSQVSVISSQRKIPVLIGKQENEVLKLMVIQNDSIQEQVSQIKVSAQGTERLEDIEKVSIFYSGNSDQFSTETLFSSSDLVDSEMVLEGSQLLEFDTSFFWISYRLNKEVDLYHSVDASLIELETSHGKASVKNDSTSISHLLQVGVALRQHEEDQVHTFRIPGLITTTAGTLLASYDIRWDSSRDLQGDIDIGVSRSTDGGQSWEPMRIAMDMGSFGGLPEKFNGVSDASLLVDENSGDIYLAGLWMHGVINEKGHWLNGLTEDSTAWNHQWRNRGSQPGYGIKQSSQFLLVKSSDDGLSWSDPVNITQMVKKETHWLAAPGPGHGITTADGTLVFPAQGRNEKGEPYSNLIVSKDHGKTWSASNPAYTNTTESMVVELSDGSLMLNMRDNRNGANKSETNGRAVAVSTDLGETWEEHGSSHGALIEPVCMASIHKHRYKEGGEEKTILLFSNPNSKFARIRQTIKVSFDEGKTWPEENWLLLDEGKGAGYSCITSIDENSIGIIYEGSQAQLTFQKIPLETLLKKK